LQIGDIALAARAVGQRIDQVIVRGGGTGGADVLLIGNAADVELGAIGIVEEFGSLDIDAISLMNVGQFDARERPTLITIGSTVVTARTAEKAVANAATVQPNATILKSSRKA
jgi:hypothetical protein